METFTCAQRGCTFEADEQPADCPVCNNPMIGDGAGAGVATWADYTKAELMQAVKDWNVTVEDKDCIEGVTSKWKKDEIIAALDATDAEPQGYE